MNKLILNINMFLFLLIPSLVLAAPSIDTYETWDSNEGTSTDNAIWINDDIDFEINGITDSDADFVCFDWDDDETYDNCYYDSDGCGGGGCNADSCDYYAVPYNMPDSWKTSCNVEGACREGTNVPERVCDGCDFDTSNIQSTYVDGVVYYDCDNSQSNRHVDTLDEVHFWVVYPKKYDCDSDAGESGDDKSGTPYYDFEGDVGATWLNIKSDVTCDPYRVCDPDSSHTYHDDIEVTSRTGSITHPCTLEDGTTENHECDDDEDCYSDNCGQNDEWTLTCTSDGSDSWSRELDNMVPSCGGQGYFLDESDDTRYCSTDVGSGYICDSDLDGVYYGNYNTNWPDDFCKKDVGESCSQDSDCWNDNGGYDCNYDYCSKCDDSTCSNGETYSNCEEDCCQNDCTGYSDSTCHSTCDNYNGCDFYNSATETACNGKSEDSTVCIDSDTYVTCCEGTPIDCNAGETCSNGECVTSGPVCGNYICESGETCTEDNCCNGDTVNFNTDENNCGSCGNKCSAGEICQQGTCTSCGGTIQAIVKDSDNTAIEDAKVYLDNVYDGLTDSAGKRDVTVSSSTCGRSYEIEIRCSDDTFCSEKTTTIDYDGDADSLTFVCDICTDEPDLFIYDEDVVITEQGGSKNITATVHSVDISATNLKVRFKKLDKDNKDVLTEDKTIPSISSGEAKDVSILWSVSASDAFVRIYVDPDNIYTETTYTNNEVTKEINPQIDIYLEMKTEFSKVNDEIEDYLKEQLEGEVRFVTDSGSADIWLAVGTKSNTQLNSYNSYTLNNLGWGYDSHMVKAHGKEGISPYNGLVGSFYKGGKARILIYGTEIEGTIASVKRFIEKKSYFLNNYEEDKDAIYLDRGDIDAIRAFDYMHTQANENDYRENSNKFAQIVSDILSDEVGELFIKDVKANDDTVLRAKQVASGMSTNYRNAVSDDPNPVVLARGIHSNLFSWQDFGEDIVKNGRDAWLIENTGGPNQECETCPVYNFTTLTDYWWPALIAGVQAYSGSDNLSYVGYSLGCSVALESLEKYNVDGKPDAGQFVNESSEWEYKDLTAYPIDTFVGVACPGNFTKLASLIWLAKKSEDNFNIIQDLKDKGKSHITIANLLVEIAHNIDDIDDIPPDYFPFSTAEEMFWYLVAQGASSIGNKMSIEIYQEFIEWIDDPTKPGLGSNVNINNALFIQGKLDKIWIPISPYYWVKVPHPLGQGTDGIVANADVANTCSNIQSNNKYYVSFDNRYHLIINPLPKDEDVQTLIKSFLNNPIVYESDFYESNEKNDCSTI